MQINLRKAAVLQSELGALLNSVNINGTVTLDQFTPVEKTISDARQVVLASIQLKTDLNKAIFEIRKSTGQANASSGIDDILTDLAYVERSIITATELAQLPIAEDLEILKAKISRNTQLDLTSTSTYSRTLNTGVSNLEALEGAHTKARELKRLKQDLKDKLLNLNISTKITLSAETVAVLRRKEVDLI